MAKRNGKTTRGPLRLYRSYVFKDKDPAIDRLRTIVQDEGLTEAQLHVLSGVSTTTFANWFRGETKRPTNACIDATYGALGWERVPQKMRSIDYKTEIPKAAKWYEAQRGK